MRILLVEDDDVVAREVEAALSEAGFVVERADNGEDAWFLGDTEDYTAAVLDLGLPRLDGLSVLRRWREEGNDLPVVVLSARGTWMERVEGIDAGADDYLPKPFEMEELLARLHAAIRRAAGRAGPVLKCGAVRLDPRRKRVTADGRAVELSPQEFRLLHYLMLHAGRTVPAAELAEHLYPDADLRDTANALAALITRLRRKIGPDVIRTRRGFGYEMAGDDIGGS